MKKNYKIARKAEAFSSVVATLLSQMQKARVPELIGVSQISL
jgi:hypothetical protein